MASRKTGTVVYKRDLSPTLTIFRLDPELGSKFPDYTAGQYIALGRDDAPLTRRVGVDPEGRAVFGPDVDDAGRRRRGPVTHSYSIASAPSETAEHGFLEFYVVLEMADGIPGRLSTVLVGMPGGEATPLHYVDRIVGGFTLEKMVRDARRVVMVATGTGLAPFISMVKELHRGQVASHLRERVYTLLHTNRTTAELAYHQTLLEIEASGTFDFLYVPTVSRPSDRDHEDPRLGAGRATNVLRLLYGLPMKEEEDVAQTSAGARRRGLAEAALADTPRPALPAAVDLETARDRLDPASVVILTCGNPASMADIQQTAARVGARCELEKW